MKEEYLKIIKEKGEFDFEVCASVEELSQKEYEELKSMLITAIGTMELMRRNQLETNWKELKKWLEEENKKTFIDIASMGVYQKVLNKMQELQGDDEK